VRPLQSTFGDAISFVERHSKGNTVIFHRVKIVRIDYEVSLGEMPPKEQCDGAKSHVSPSATVTGAIIGFGYDLFVSGNVVLE
jgi:hypothetical protein